MVGGVEKCFLLKEQKGKSGDGHETIAVSVCILVVVCGFASCGFAKNKKSRNFCFERVVVHTAYMTLASIIHHNHHHHHHVCFVCVCVYIIVASLFCETRLVNAFSLVLIFFFCWVTGEFQSPENPLIPPKNPNNAVADGRNTGSSTKATKQEYR